MGSSFFDIPFRMLSSDSDFSCRDGEIAKAGGASVKGDGFEVSGDNLAIHESGPPVPDIEFALVRDCLTGWHNHPDIFPSKTLVASHPSMEYWTTLASRLLAQFQSEATLNKKFVAPFYAFAAWKTYDGFFLSPSSPVLLIPNSSVPLVAIDGDIAANELEFKIAGAICALYMKMRAPEALREWVGKIASLEIMVSSPVMRYDTFASFVPARRVSSDSFCRSLDLSSGVITDRRICSETFDLAWKGIESPSAKAGESARSYYSLASIPLAEVDLLENYTNPLDKSIGDNLILPATSVSYGDILDSSYRASKAGTISIIGTGSEIDVMTRPVKLSGAGEFKNVQRVFLRGDYSPSAISLSVYASRDMMQWWCVANKKGGTTVVLPHSSFRFYKIHIRGLLVEGCSLQGLSMLLCV